MAMSPKMLSKIRKITSTPKKRDTNNTIIKARDAMRARDKLGRDKKSLSYK